MCLISENPCKVLVSKLRFNSLQFAANIILEKKISQDLMYYKYLLEYLVIIQKPIILAVLPYCCYFHLKHSFKTV